MEEVMRVAKSGLVAVFAGLAMGCGLTAVQAAPLPTNVAAMKSMAADDTAGALGLARWLGLSCYRGWGYRPWGALAAGAVVGGAIASSAYYGGYPYYGGYGGYGGYYGGGSYNGCYPYATGYGYPAYSYRGYYGW
jgi:hypothetical protein